jgi:SNF2 family DNA or RNA helicase
MVDNESSATAIKGGILADDMGLGKTVTGTWDTLSNPSLLTAHSLPPRRYK